MNKIVKVLFVGFLSVSLPFGAYAATTGGLLKLFDEIMEALEAGRDVGRLVDNLDDELRELHRAGKISQNSYGLLITMLRDQRHLDEFDDIRTALRQIDEVAGREDVAKGAGELFDLGPPRGYDDVDLQDTKVLDDIADGADDTETGDLTEALAGLVNVPSNPGLGGKLNNKGINAPGAGETTELTVTVSSGNTADGAFDAASRGRVQEVFDGHISTNDVASSSTSFNRARRPGGAAQPQVLHVTVTRDADGKLVVTVTNEVDGAIEPIIGFGVERQIETALSN